MGIKSIKWALKSREEKDQIMMRMRIKEALRNQSDFVLTHIDEIVEEDIMTLEPMELGKRWMTILTALINEGYDINKATDILMKAYSI